MGDQALLQGRRSDAVDGEGSGSTPATSRIIHPDGTLQLTDRTKDVIKSGGEWISSVELENAAVGHPGSRRGGGDRHRASQVGRAPDPGRASPRKARSRPREDVLAHLEDKVAKWWLPDAVEFVDDIPHTGTGKISKKDLRERFRDYRLVEDEVQ